MCQVSISTFWTTNKPFYNIYFNKSLYSRRLVCIRPFKQRRGGSETSFYCTVYEYFHALPGKKPPVVISKGGF